MRKMWVSDKLNTFNLYSNSTIDYSFKSSDSTTIDPFDEMLRRLKGEFEVLFDFGIKIKDRNIIYFFILKDKLSPRWGISLSLGSKDFSWDNCEAHD